MTSQRVVETTYVGQTETRPSRIRARHVTTRERRFVSWDHALDAFSNHLAAATALLGCEPAWYASIEGGGYLFGAGPNV